MGFGIAAEDAPVRRRSLLRPFEAAFVMVALGFVAHEVVGEIKWLDAAFHMIPTRLHTLAPAVPFGWFEALWFLMLLPLAVWAAIAGISYLAGHRSGLKALLLAAATGAAPVVAAAHLAKALAKTTSWGGFLPLALADPRGLETYRAIAGHSLPEPAALLGLTAIGWIMLISLALIASRALRWTWDVPSQSLPAVRVGTAFSAALFTLVLAAWSWGAP